MMRIVIPVAGVVTGLWLSAASALGLGEIQVRSHLNQRFDAVIPLSGASSDEAASLRVGLAGADDFARAGIEHADYLSTLRFAVRTDGTPRIEIHSEQVAHEPYVQLLLDIRGSGNRILRQYTVLLDPPEFSAAESASRRTTPAPIADAEPAQAMPVPAESTPAVVPAKPAARPAPATSTPAAPQAAATVAAGAGELYGPVKPAETLWSIATRMRPSPDITMDQVLLAIYNGNPRAFDGGINGLQKGAMLRVPSAADMKATPAADAKTEVARLRGLPASAARGAAPPPRRPQIEPATIAPPPPASPKVAQQPSAETPPPPASAPTGAAAAPEPAASTSAGTASGQAEAAPAPAASAAAAPPAPVAAPAEPAPEPAKSQPLPPREEGGLLESLLIPLVLGLLLLFGIAFLYTRWKQRRAAPAAPPPLPPSGGRRMPLTQPSAGKMAAAGVAGAGAAAAATAAASKPSAKTELERLEETLDTASEADVAATPQTQTLTAEPGPAEAAALPPVDFDLTGQFAAQTVQIDLDANDPVSEADFHLAYGLYDEAALLLKQAAAKEPGRTDITVKLAETYFAAGKVAEFEETAAGLKDKLPAAEWQKLAIMGQQLDPSSPLFGDAAATPLETDLDLGFDAPEVAAAPAEHEVPAAKSPSTLDFQLDDLELSSLDAGKVDEPKADQGNAVEFDLGDFDMGESPAPAAAPPAVPADRGNALDFDLSGFDVEPQAGTVPPATSAPAADIRLDEFDFDTVPTDAGEISGDEAGTKLDLARAYVDMGDNEMARGLLNEVLQQGNAAQQQDARHLLGRLG